MPLPQAAEYDDALQNPVSSFIDPELQRGFNDGPIRMGAPGPVACGNFAIIYRFRSSAKRYAVKCFIRSSTDQQKRYACVYEALKEARFEWMVDFQYQARGVRVKGAIHPLVKMEWIDAMTLLEWAPKTLGDRSAFRNVSDDFLALVEALSARSIAHGDLQHGNLLIAAGRLKVVDYDGMCVPGTAGLVADENGLSDYQHPLRDGGLLAPHFDHFSTFVIWISLYGLSLDPTLWRRYVGHAERLLFTKEDFLRPDDSSLFKELLRSDDARLKAAANALKDACSLTDLGAIPSILDVLPPVSSQAHGASKWWRESGGATSIAAESMPASDEIIDWIESQRQPTVVLPSVRFGGNFTTDRILVGLYVAAIVVGILSARARIAAPALAVLVESSIGLAVLLWLYCEFEVTVERYRKALAATALRAAVDRRNQLALDAAHAARLRAQEISELKSAIEVKARQADEIESARLAADIPCNQELRQGLSEIVSARSAVDRNEQKELVQLLREKTEKEADLAARLAEIARERDPGQAEMRRAALESERRKCIADDAAQRQKARAAAEIARQYLKSRESSLREISGQKRSEILAPFRHEGNLLQCVIGPERHRAEQMKARDQSERMLAKKRQRALAKEIGRLESDLERYAGIDFKGFLRALFFL